MTGTDDPGTGDPGTDNSVAADPVSDDQSAAERAAVKARVDAVFGQTLPETTSDEARGRDSRIDDDWWREQRPPHHG